MPIFFIICCALDVFAAAIFNEFNDKGGEEVFTYFYIFIK